MARDRRLLLWDAKSSDEAIERFLAGKTFDESLAAGCWAGGRLLGLPIGPQPRGAAQPAPRDSLGEPK
jgi:hypothetical protein